LQRRSYSAWKFITLLTGIGIIVSLLKGFDYEEAILLSIVLFALVASRKQFQCKEALKQESFNLGWSSTILVIVICSIWLGLFAFQSVDYSNQLWWTFTFEGNVSRFLRASIAVVIFLLFFAVSKWNSHHGALE
ncbi:MAG: hypothetical protein QM501_09155, partial [Gimesia sp.]